MYSKLPLVFFLIVLSALLACKKNSAPKPQSNPNIDVYVAGYAYYGAAPIPIATYWKNNVANRLVSDTTSSSMANAITLAGNDIYTAGTFLGSAAFWKNGQVTKLTSIGSEAVAISLNGNDVYVAGDIAIGNLRVAAYWKNGTMIRLVTDSSSFSKAYGIACKGQDVYVVGYLTADGITQAVCWKNGQAIILGDGSVSSGATAITIFGSDIYISGTVGNNSTNAVYWKNGVKNTISQTNSRAFGIAINDNNVYLVGDNSIFSGANLGNGVITNLPFSSEALAIALNGTDIYTAGSMLNGSKTDAVYWKNGATTQLGQNAVALGIALKAQ